MLERALHPRVKTALEEFLVVGLLGLRQVGKTTLAQDIRAIARHHSMSRLRQLGLRDVLHIAMLLGV